ncbi:type I restriction enzyme, S subunit [Vibrio crassostreae]|uniref:restriction endonuclease subunit S n=1 Tax=Vibrio crassostreae TaxID=246167 RepID=UPI001BD4F1E8|nr:restriction endonuclease subunit S [Vibrio crassostreae]CAK2057496.1 type I restriction enzyme, S subunit [Vibrio crassostreae]CAK2355191.1 type I restriction enzyme, S subunit [Vibrio crassostreae]CAK2814873.1 type I restriction enzyme, S subunit [Vibrio crassostreae]CAK2912150.1 type I restriction enzyme, S subunit [Vibrio crassostreae]CAK2985051.1 type I restriction enzyme, S subunit [Vibrio crassostreae]
MTFKQTPLNEFITLQRGFDLPKGDRVEGDIPVVASTGVGGYHNESKVKAPGVVIGRSGSIGGGQYITDDFWPLNTTLWIKDFKGHDPRYVYYLMRSIDFTKFNVGSGVPTLNRNHLSSLLVNELGVGKEKCIAKYLGDIDDKIDLNTEVNQNFELMAQAIFKSWFVDFDPVKAKMNNEQPEGMDVATASLFPEKLVETELGLIPEGWEVTKLSKVIDLLNGFAFKSPDYVKEGTFVLRTKNFDSSNSVERLGDDVYLPDEFLESHKKYLCEAYDYHVVMVAASIGKTGMIYPHQLPALRNQNMWCFRPKNESLRFYTKYMVDGLVKLNMGLASGSARAFFKKGDFNSYEFALPSSELLTKFNDVVGNLVKQKGSLLNQNVQLAAMRDTLLPKLLSGEIELDKVLDV